MPDRVHAAYVQTDYRETVMIVDYNRSPNITEEERLASLQDSVQRALDELMQMISGIETPEKSGLVEKVEVVTQTAGSAKQRAVYSQSVAEEAQSMADEAGKAAQTAWEYADQAKGAADEAQSAADEAQGSADEAHAQAVSAYVSASAAIGQLSIVEDIVGILDLIADHGVYGLTQDTEIKPDKWYFTVTGNAVANPTGNPNLQGWYEKSAGVYFLTEDTTVQVGTTYYTLTVSPVIAPDVSIIGTYYELIDIDTAIQNYVSSHLVLVNDTLSLQNGATRVSLSTNAANGLTFYNDGQQVAQYGSDAVIGDPNSFHITITSNYQGTGDPRISFYNNSANEVAYISGDMLYITKTVVIEQMDVGDEDGQWSWKIHKVNGANNLYLKWLG